MPASRSLLFKITAGAMVSFAGHVRDVIKKEFAMKGLVTSYMVIAMCKVVALVSVLEKKAYKLVSKELCCYNRKDEVQFNSEPSCCREPECALDNTAVSQIKDYSLMLMTTFEFLADIIGSYNFIIT